MLFYSRNKMSGFHKRKDGAICSVYDAECCAESASCRRPQTFVQWKRTMRLNNDVYTVHGYVRVYVK